MMRFSIPSLVMLLCSIVAKQAAAQSDAVHSTIAAPSPNSAAHAHAEQTGEETNPSQASPAWATSLEDFLNKRIAKHQIPGASLAVMHQGRLLYARGFGYADRENEEPVQPESRFRIASLSKPITAAAILKLSEAGKLDLDADVFSVLTGYEPVFEDGEELDTRLKQITLRQLLQHRGGWDRGMSGDPMFKSRKIAQSLGYAPPAQQRDVIRYTLGKPLDFAPGERYCYSNFGYCLLGRVIEQLSGQDYESFVQEQVLEPAGITSMQLGRTLPQFRAAQEVKYYDPGFGTSVFKSHPHRKVPQPYGAWDLESMDSHGGWIASATELAKFGAKYYGDPEDSLLSKKALQATVARPPGKAGYADDGTPKQRYYGLGWTIIAKDSSGQRNLTHNGSLPGTSSLLVCREDGTCYALLCNSRKSEFTNSFCGDILGELIEVMASIEWPNAE